MTTHRLEGHFDFPDEAAAERFEERVRQLLQDAYIDGLVVDGFGWMMGPVAGNPGGQCIVCGHARHDADIFPCREVIDRTGGECRCGGESSAVRACRQALGNPASSPFIVWWAKRMLDHLALANEAPNLASWRFGVSKALGGTEEGLVPSHAD